MTAESANSVVALVPMRHHSERVPGKNYRLFAGEPLYRHVVRALIECPQISVVVINTDSHTIMDDAAKVFGNNVILRERPQNLRDGSIPMNDIILDDVAAVSADFYLQTHSTNPLLRSSTISRYLDVFIQNYPKFDSLFSVTRLQTRLWDGAARPINHDPEVLLRTQDLDPVYEENSCMYVFTKEVLIERRNRIGSSPLMVEIEPIEACDIDEEMDFQVAEFLFEKHRRGVPG